MRRAQDPPGADRRGTLRARLEECRRLALAALAGLALPLNRVLAAGLAERAPVDLAAARSLIAFTHENLCGCAMQKGRPPLPTGQRQAGLEQLHEAYQRFGAPPPPRLPPALRS